MSAVSDTSTDWQREVLRLKYGPQQMTSAEIAEAVGKHAATVRKVVARATPDEIHEATGQTTVDDHLPSEEPDPFDDPEHPDALAQFREQAGEAVGPMPPDQDPPEPISYEVRLAGTRQMALDFGENADVPIGGTLVIKSDKLASGFYGLGDLVEFTATARIVDVAGKERMDSASEEFRAKPQHHVALITEVAIKPVAAAG